VRELENLIERALALCNGSRITPDDLNLTLPANNRVSDVGTDTGKYSLPDYLDRIERRAILRALRKTGFNRTAAARLLGVTFRTLRYRMERLGITEKEGGQSGEA
jgi:two-component system response regulator PilR (NtrC family)